jgi:hypothetical protein
METFTAAAKCQGILLMIYDRESMPERSWNRTKLGLERVLSCRFSACWVYLIGQLTKGFLTESLTELRPTEWRTILTGEDPHSPRQLDTHPLVREYFGEQLRNRQTEAWKECNRRADSKIDIRCSTGIRYGCKMMTRHVVCHNIS